jgi:hypothetical protein
MMRGYRTYNRSFIDSFFITCAAVCAFADKPTQQEAGEKNHQHSAHYDPSKQLLIHTDLLYLCVSLERSGAMQSGSLLEGQREIFKCEFPLLGVVNQLCFCGREPKGMDVKAHYLQVTH